MDTFLRIANDCLAYLSGVKWEDGLVTLGVCLILAICAAVIGLSVWRGTKRLGLGASSIWDRLFGPSVLAREILVAMSNEGKVDEERRGVTVPGRLHVGYFKGHPHPRAEPTADAIVVTQDGTYRILDDTHLSKKDRDRILRRRDALVRATRLARIASEKMEALLQIRHGDDAAPDPVGNGTACAAGTCTSMDCPTCEAMTAPKSGENIPIVITGGTVLEGNSKRPLWKNGQRP